jgi:cell pole-organizing protein PopZ
MGEMQTDPSMEEILASIKRVIAEDGRNAAPRARRAPAEPNPLDPEPADDDVLELDDAVAEDSGLMSSDAAAASRRRLAALSSLNPRAELDCSPLEALVREVLKPMLKEWLDEHLPGIVESLVTREIARITGRKL